MNTGKRNRAAFEEQLQAQQSPFVLYGTPLPPLDPDVRDDGSYVPVWMQTVTDERGRKRLHGAFTGGFSAGYFNTVGSKEGWTPKNFVSSRQNRHNADDGKATGQRPEDFMDEEDLAEAAEAQKLHTSGSFAGLGSGDGAQDSGLFRQREDTIGMKLLQRMGWRPGQGIGLKIRRKARLDDATNETSDDDDGTTHLFPPENVSMIKLVKKQDYKGLDFATDSLRKIKSRPSQSAELAMLRGADDEEDEDGPAMFKPKAKSKKVKPKKSSFGVGVLNDTGSDDEDPYEMGPRVSYNSSISTGKENKVKKLGAKPLTVANPLLTAKPTFRPRKELKSNGNVATRKCHDGKEALNGFVLAKSTLSSTSIPKSAQPKIPPGWKLSRITAASKEAAPPSTTDAKAPAVLDAAGRARALGESPLPGKSVFDFLSKGARSQIATASGRSDLPPALGEGAPAEFASQNLTPQPRLSDFITPPSKPVAEAALGRMSKGWTPYSADSAKSARYQSFLAICCSAEQRPPTRPPDVTHKDWVAELREFAHAAQVFKPVTGLMASRFTAASNQAPADPANASEEPIITVPTIASNPAEEAAKAGMFGPLTRSVQPWQPTRLLCKRFGVPMPEIIPESAAPSAKLQLLNMATAVPEMVAQPEGAGKEAAAPTRAEPRVDVERNEALEKERAGDEVFRAIFGDSDEG